MYLKITLFKLSQKKLVSIKTLNTMNLKMRVFEIIKWSTIHVRPTFLRVYLSKLPWIFKWLRGVKVFWRRYYERDSEGTRYQRYVNVVIMSAVVYFCWRVLLVFWSGGKYWKQISGTVIILHISLICYHWSVCKNCGFGTQAAGVDLCFFYLLQRTIISLLVCLMKGHRWNHLV